MGICRFVVYFLKGGVVEVEVVVVVVVVVAKRKGPELD